MNKHLCIGGPLDGQQIDWETACKNGYSQFNCASGCSRTKRAYRLAAEQGRVIPPTMVYIHDSCFKEN